MKLVTTSAWLSFVFLGLVACGSDEQTNTASTAATTGSTGATATGGGEGGAMTTGGGGGASTGTATGGGGAGGTGGGAGGTGGGGGAGGAGGAASCEGATPGGDVTGIWHATMGGQTYLELTQSDACVSGTTCEVQGKDCFSLQNGTLDGNTLTYFYTFGTVQVDATLTLSADGTTMTGELYSTKCACSNPYTYVKQ
jgi:hypothetical protein